MSLRKMVTDADGNMSRTQVIIVIYQLLSLVLVVLEVILGGILTTTVLVAMAGLFAFAIIDRIDARHIDFKVSKAGAEVSIRGDKK